MAEGHLLKYKTFTQRVNFQRIQDLPQLINKKPTQKSKQNHMLIKKMVAEGHLPKYKTCPQLPSSQRRQDMSQLLNKKPTQNTKQKAKPKTQSKTTCLLEKKVAEGHLLKYKTCTQRVNFQRIQDSPQLINKKPTQNTKQNHMLIKKEGGRRPSKVQDMPSTTKLTKKTRHVPTDEQEINTEHEATLHVY